MRKIITPVLGLFVLLCLSISFSFQGKAQCIPDLIDPTVVGCPADQSYILAPFRCDTVASYTMPTVTDNCPGFSQNINPDSVEVGAGIMCTSGGITRINNTIRRFSLQQDFGLSLTDTLNVKFIEFGIETATAGTGFDGMQPGTIELYSWDSTTAFTYANFTSLSSTSIQIEDGTLYQKNYRVTPATVPAGEWLVVDLAIPDGLTPGHRIFPGGNFLGANTDSTYIASSTCGIANPVSYGSIGFPNRHWVVKVNAPIIELIQGPAPGDTVGVGTFDVLYVAEDGECNVDSCTFTLEYLPNFRFPFDTCTGVPSSATPSPTCATFSFDNKCFLPDPEKDPPISDWPSGCKVDTFYQNTMIFPIRTAPKFPMADDLFVTIDNIVASDGGNLSAGLFGPTDTLSGCPDSGSFPPLVSCGRGGVIIFLSDLSASKDSIYWLVIDGEGGNTATFDVDVCGNALPVELANFRGYRVNGQHHLEWVTASEVNNFSFYIQRSTDGSNWNIIGQRSGAGNSSTSLEYNFVDENPLPGKNYYRIRQVDFDGSFEHSHIILLENDYEGVSDLGIAPNPVKTVMDLAFNSSVDQELRLELMNIAGKVLKAETFVANEGANKFDLNVEDFAPGMYMLQMIEENGNVQVIKFEKL